MGKGVDLWAGEIVCKLRDNDSRIKLVAANPYEGFGKDYAHPDDFYYDYRDDFWDYEDAEDYWEKHH